jgi:hypothetical protein
MRSSLPDLSLLQDDIMPPAIDLNRTPAPVESTKATQKRPRDMPPVGTLHVRIMFDEMPTSILDDSI